MFPREQDLAPKADCPPSFEKIPGTGDTVSPREIEMFFFGIHLPTCATKKQDRFLRQGEKRNVSAREVVISLWSVKMEGSMLYFRYLES